MMRALVMAFALGAGTAPAPVLAQTTTLPSQVVHGAAFAYCMAGDLDHGVMYFSHVLAVQLPIAPSLEARFKTYIRAHYPAPGPKTPTNLAEPTCFANHDRGTDAAHRGLRMGDMATYDVKAVEVDWSDALADPH